MLDSHHHLWNYKAAEYPWIPAGSPGSILTLVEDTSAPGVDGLIHVSEMSWSKKQRKPSDILRKGESVEVSRETELPEPPKQPARKRATRKNPSRKKTTRRGPKE